MGNLLAAFLATLAEAMAIVFIISATAKVFEPNSGQLLVGVAFLFLANVIICYRR